MKTNYQDRLVDDAFEGDVQCEVRLQPDPRDEGRAGRSVWISERLLARLRPLGLAYDLQLLARLPTTGHVIYPEVQLPVFEDELAFLFDVVSDPALLRATLPIRDLMERAQREARGWSLVVETP